MRIVTGLLSLTFLFASCTIYRSPERKDFESKSPNFKISALKLQTCTTTSVASQAQASRLITVSEATNEQSDSVALWEHIVENTSQFESNNFKGEYCLYDYQHP